MTIADLWAPAGLATIGILFIVLRRPLARLFNFWYSLWDWLYGRGVFRITPLGVALASLIFFFLAAVLLAGTLLAPPH